MTKRVRAEDDVGRQILLRSTGDGVEGLPEYNMIELNGTVQPTWEGMPVGRQVHEPQLLDGQELGDFSMTVLGKPQLVIGSHRLIGKVEKFREPVAILRKRKRSETSSGEEGETEFQIAGVVREKYVFKARPKPVLNKWNKRTQAKAEKDEAQAQEKATRKEARLQREEAAKVAEAAA